MTGALQMLAAIARDHARQPSQQYRRQHLPQLGQRRHNLPQPNGSPPPAAPAPATTTRPVQQLPGATTGANQFSTEAQAKAHCPGDTVVWANIRSHIYHFNQTRYYGTTEKGTYMCEKEAIAAGNRAAKNETHP